MRILIVLLSLALTFGCMRAPALDEAEAVAVTRAARELLQARPNKTLHATALRNATRERWRYL